MRLIAIVFAVLGIVCGTLAVPTNTHDDEVGFGPILDCIIAVLNVGVPDFGVPSLNPLELDRYIIYLSDWNISEIRGNLGVSDLLFTGLLDLNVESLTSVEDGDYFEISATISWPKTVLSTITYGDFDLFGLNLYGSGRLDYSLNNLRIEFGVKGTLNESGLSLIEATFIPTIEGFSDFTITGVYDDEELSAELSRDILENGPDYLNDASELLNETVAPLIVEIINRTNTDGSVGLILTLVNMCLDAKY